MEEKAKYKNRRLARLNGHAAKPRDKMPWWYESVMADFSKREKDQLEAAQKGPLSTNPMVPWGNDKPRRQPDEGEGGRVRRGPRDQA